MRNVGAAILGALTALGVCAAVVFGGVLNSKDNGKASTAETQQTAASKSSSSATSVDLAELYNSVKNGVVYVQAGQSASGSGFVISSDGYIVTNEHVVAESNSYTVRIGETDKTVPATLVGADASTDLALLKVDTAQTGTLHPLPLADNTPEVGDEVIAIGSPFGLQSTLTSGIVSSLNRTLESPNGHSIGGAIQTDAAINPGNSGGPLLNTDGQVIGVNAQIASQSGGSTGVGFAISVTTVKSEIPQLKAGGGTGTQSQSQDPTQQVDPSQQQQQQDPFGQSDPTDPSQGGSSGGMTQEELQQLLEQLQQQQEQPQQQDPFGQADPYGQSDPYGQQYALPGMG
jgi:putative serine protease PepD